MTSRVRKARIPGLAGERVIFSADQWALIEKVYGYSLPPEIRDRIIIATDALRVVSAAEQHAPALNKIRAKTKKLRNAAKSFLQETGHLVNENASCASFEELADALNTVVKECPNDHLQFMLVVKAMLSACDLMLRKCESDEGLREGWIWDAWVQSISECMKHHGLPSAARTDSDKRNSEKVNSKFVWLIKELQKHIPIELRRHHNQSLNALAKAIQRARKSNWWLKLLPPEIREKFAADLEAPEERAKRYASFKQTLRTSPDWVELSPGQFERVEMIKLMKRD